MHPLSYIRRHPMATLITAAGGMIVGPWIVSTVKNMTGVGVSLPTFGGNGN